MSDEQRSLLNVNCDISGGAAKLLVEKISNACGMLYAPVNEVVSAYLEGEAAKIRERKGKELEDMELRRRGAIRFVGQLGRKQANLEAIVTPVVAQLSKDASAKTEEIDEDWLAEFTEKCANTSNDHVRKFWSQLLLGECQAPGQFSKRTIARLAELSSAEARYFENRSRYIWWLKPQLPVFVMEDMKNAGWSVLINAGLVESTGGFNGSTEAVHSRQLIQYGSRIDRVVSENRILICDYLLTSTGRELAKRCKQSFEFPEKKFPTLFAACNLEETHMRQ